MNITQEQGSLGQRRAEAQLQFNKDLEREIEEIYGLEKAAEYCEFLSNFFSLVATSKPPILFGREDIGYDIEYWKDTSLNFKKQLNGRNTNS